MRLATVHTPGGTSAVRIDANGTGSLLPFASVGDLLQDPNWRDEASAEGPIIEVNESQFAPLIRQPGKIFCQGLNYLEHIHEMGRPIPEHPTLFAKWPDTLIGPFDEIVVDEARSHALDWEGELALIIGSEARRATGGNAAAAIAGFTVLNDISMRDWQNRSNEWVLGKCWEATTPYGPVLVTSDEFDWTTSRIQTTVNGEIMQDAGTDDLVFTPEGLVEYISTISTLRPGDIIATGTPGGVGHAMNPPQHLKNGDVVEVSVEGIGTIRSTIRISRT